MKRRALLMLSAGAAAFVLVGRWPTAFVTADAHEGSAGLDSFGLQLADLNPDRMWPVYRRYHLLIVGQRDDGRSSAFTAAVVDVLSHYLPVLALSWSAPRMPGASACSSLPFSKTSPSCRPKAQRRSFWRSM
jgi:hypothetical protein